MIIPRNCPVKLVDMNRRISASGLERSVGWSLLCVCVCTSWARSGMYGPWLPWLWIPAAVFFGLSAACLLCADGAGKRRFFSDPLLPLGLLFSALLLIQWQNTGGQPFVAIFTQQLSYTPPRWAGWPFSIDAHLSRQPLFWFIPAMSFLLVVRNLLSRETCQVLFQGLMFNAALLAGFGIVQFGLGWTELFNRIVIESQPHFIATFVYPNHGGQFFYLWVAIALGLLLDGIQKKKPPIVLILHGLSALLFAVAAFCSLSRAAVLAVCALSISALLAGVGIFCRWLSPAGWVRMLLLGIAVSAVLVCGIVRIGNGVVLKEFTSSSMIERDIKQYGEMRGFQIPPAIDMVKEYPWFGVGGWGYPKYVRSYLPKNQWARLGRGKANVHCDPVQFLAEHGVVGFGLMGGMLATLLWPWRRFRHWQTKGLPIMTALGCGLILAHSLVDLPFRNPTVLWHWLLLMTLVPLLAEEQAANKPGSC